MRRDRGRTPRAGVGADVARGLCLSAAVLALLLLGHEIGVGVRAVSRGDITPAQMLVDLGEWMRGMGDEE